MMWDKRWGERERGRGAEKIVDINALKMMINRKAPENFALVFFVP